MRQPSLEILQTEYNFNASGTIDDIVKSIKENKTLDEAIQKRILSIALIAQREASASEKGIKSLEKEIRIWFDQSMERASGVYNRNVKGVAFLIGLGVTLAINADTFHILERLNKDAALRSSINQVASNVISNKKQDIENCLMGAKKMENSREKLTKQNQCFEEINTGLDNITMPLGWDPSNFPTSIKELKELLKKPVNQLLLNNKGLLVLGGIIKLLVGWLLSAAAIAMGAPFWFDLLGKFINVRNAGKVPESTSNDKPS